MAKALVTGAGGFIGYHLSKYLVKKGYWVRGADLKYPEFGETACHEFLLLDLRLQKNCLRATEGIEEVYALAANMGGMGFISANHATIMYDNSFIDFCTLEAARQNRCKRFFYPSSACVYPGYRQVDANVIPLKEEDAYPADPQDAYGWQKLTTEKLCSYYSEECGLEVRIARLHNIFGPQGTWGGGREKAPAAICRKAATAKLTGNPEVEIWGDGHQTRSFCYIDDCLVGIDKLMHSNYSQPLNLGQDRLVTINQLVDMIAEIAGIQVVKKYIPGPQGARGRNSDNRRLLEVLGWVPQISLEEGLKQTYEWIENQVIQSLKNLSR